MAEQETRNKRIKLLGENYASSMGLNIRQTRLLIILNTSVLAGTVTAFCGPIAFFGIALPHLTRMLFNTTNHLLLTPMIILFGAAHFFWLRSVYLNVTSSKPL